MRYILPCFLDAPIRRYHQTLVDEIATRFDLPFTRRQGIAAHFTLKYHFETDDVRPWRSCSPTSRVHAAPVTVGGQPLRRDVIYVTVTPSAAARAVLGASTRPRPALDAVEPDGREPRPMTVAESPPAFRGGMALRAAACRAGSTAPR
jgi:hypothetical protein